MSEVLRLLLRYYQLMESIDAGNDAEAMLLASDEVEDHAVLGELSGIRGKLSDVVFVEGYPPMEGVPELFQGEDKCPICGMGDLSEEILSGGAGELLLLTCNHGCGHQWLIDYQEDNLPSKSPPTPSS